MTTHASDCAIHNAPAFEVGSCDCKAVDIERDREILYAARGALKTEWTKYRRTNIAEMRPYDPNADREYLQTAISVSGPDGLLLLSDTDEFNRGFIARNPQNHADQWYVARAYFDANFEPIPE